MRRLLVILMLLAGCQLLSERAGGLRAVQWAQKAVFSACDAHADQWQCARLCNSDLDQPRLLRTAEAAPAAPSFRLGDRNPVVRTPLRCVAACGCGTGVAKLNSSFRSFDLPAGRHAVDHYVYRLRRLII